MGIGQSYEAYEKELLEREVRAGFEKLDDTLCSLSDAINYLDGKKRVDAIELLEKATELINKFLKENEGDIEDLERESYYETQDSVRAWANGGM